MVRVRHPARPEDVLPSLGVATHGERVRVVGGHHYQSVVLAGQLYCRLNIIYNEYSTMKQISIKLWLVYGIGFGYRTFVRFQQTKRSWRINCFSGTGIKNLILFDVAPFLGWFKGTSRLIAIVNIKYLART